MTPPASAFKKSRLDQPWFAFSGGTRATVILRIWTALYTVPAEVTSNPFGRRRGSTNRHSEVVS